MAIADLLAKLVELKSQLVTNLNSMGVTADESEKLNTLVPKVLECKTDVIWPQGTVSTEVTSVNIPNGVTSIGDYAFDDCANLTSITIPNSVTNIGNSVFDGCTNLANITIPDSVTSIGKYAFNWCKGLTSITIPDSVTSIGLDAFSACTNLASINVSEKNENYSSVDGIFFNKNITELIKYPAAKTISEYSVPNSVTSIGYAAFASCTNLANITIPDSVTSIGYGAFASCANLASITIPNSVTSIEGRIFSSCANLASITIPNSVTSIGDGAFMQCKNLANIYYKGTEEQWNAIAKGSAWDLGMGMKVEGGTVITYNYTG